MQMNPSSSQSVAPVKTVLQIMWFAMLSSIVLLAVVGERAAQGTAQRPQVVFVEAITLVAIVLVIAQAVLRRKFLTVGAQLLAQDPTSRQGLMRWRAGHIVGYAMSEAVALFGLVLRFLGFTLREVAPFYVAGVILMLFSAPKVPPDGGPAT